MYFTRNFPRDGLSLSIFTYDEIWRIDGTQFWYFFYMVHFEMKFNPFSIFNSRSLCFQSMAIFKKKKVFLPSWGGSEGAGHTKNFSNSPAHFLKKFGKVNFEDIKRFHTFCRKQTFVEHENFFLLQTWWKNFFNLLWGLNPPPHDLEIFLTVSFRHFSVVEGRGGEGGPAQLFSSFRAQILDISLFRSAAFAIFIPFSSIHPTAADFSVVSKIRFRPMTLTWKFSNRYFLNNSKKNFSVLHENGTPHIKISKGWCWRRRNLPFDSTI